MQTKNSDFYWFKTAKGNIAGAFRSTVIPWSLAGKNVAAGTALLLLGIAVSGQTAGRSWQRARIPVKAGPWLSPLKLNPKDQTDPLQAFQRWRRANRNMLPVIPEVWQAHKQWMALHPQRARQATRRRAPARLERAGKLDLAGVISGGNIIPVSGLSEYQGEIAAAVNPGNSRQMLAAANTALSDPQCGNIATQALYSSQDGGQDWDYSCAPVPSTLPYTLFGSDPSLAWDANGDAYASYMLLRPDPNMGQAYDTAIVVAKSSDAGQSWAPLGIVVNHYGDAFHFDDKEMMAIDRSQGQSYSHANRLYVIWDENNTEVVGWSDDGANWTPVVLEDAMHASDDIGGDLAVGADGTVYAIWTRIGGAPNLNGSGDELVFTKSTDGGRSWTPPLTIAGGQLATFVGSNVFIPAQDQRGINTFGSIAVDDSTSPYAGSIYVVYANTPPGVSSPIPLAGIPTQTAVDIYLTRSSDRGLSWSPPEQVNDDPNDAASHFFPWCAVDPSNGILSVAWYDTRNDPGFLMQTQIYYAQSTDGGASFTPNLEVTQPTAGFANSSADSSDENSSENIFYNPNQYGDYTQVSASGGKVLIGWTDSRQMYPEDGVNPLAEDLTIDTLQNGQNLSYTISGQVTDANGQSISGVTLAAGGENAISDGEGRYTLAGLANGSYTVTAGAPNYSFSPNAAAVMIASAPVAGIDFVATATAASYAISGTVTLNGQVLAGVTISDGTASVVTGANGRYLFAGLPAGSYTVTAVDASYSFTPASQVVTLAVGDATGVNFSVPVYSISGTISETWAWGSSVCCTKIGRMAGATVEAGNKTVTTDANGEYTISGLPAGTYIVTAQAPGFIMQPVFAPFLDNLTDYVFLTDADHDNVDFVAQADGLNEVTGTVTQNGVGVSGVKIISEGQPAGDPDNTFAVSDSQGNFVLFENDGTYTLTPSKPGYSFTPGSQSLSIGGSSENTSENFTATSTQGFHSLSGQVMAGGTGVQGATIAAGLNSGRSDAQGNYTIHGLSDGSYRVDAAANGDVFTPARQTVAVAGSDLSGINFSGAAALFSISGNITNANGQPLAGVKVLTGEWGSINPITTTTDTQGNYTLSGLPPQIEAYSVNASDPGYSFLPVFNWAPVESASVTGVNFTAGPALSVSGTIRDAGGQGVAGIYISLDAYTGQQPPQTNQEGNYSLTLPPGNYTVTPVDANRVYNFTPRSARFSLSTSNLSGVDFTAAQKYQLAGQVLNGTVGVPGANVALFLEAMASESAAYAGTAVSDAHGIFYFDNVPTNEKVYLIPTLAGEGLNMTRPTVFQVTPGAVVSGTVKDPLGNPLSQVPIWDRTSAGSGSQGVLTFTDPNGNFAISMPEGSYTIFPQDYAHVFTPANINISVQPGSAVSGVNFSGVTPTLSMTLGQTLYNINSSVDTLSDPIAFSSNVNQPVFLSCGRCSSTPASLTSQESGTLTFSGLTDWLFAQQAITVQASLLQASQSQTVTIIRQDFMLTTGSDTATVNAGQIANYTVNVSSVNAYAGAASITCYSQAHYSCSVTPSTISLAANGATPVTIEVNTAAKTSGAPVKLPPDPWEGYGGAWISLGIAALFWGSRWRLKRWKRGLACTALMLSLALNGCGGSLSYTPPPPPPSPPVTTTTTSSVTVTAQTGYISQTLTLTLNVKTTS